MTAIDYALILSRIVASSSRIKSLLLPHYGEQFSVSVGSEQDRANFQALAPYAFFHPLEEEARPDRSLFSVRMELGLCHENVVTLGGVPVLAAYRTLSALVPLALSQIADHLPGMVDSPARLENYRVGYEQASYPLVQAFVDIEIVQPTTVGHRRVI